MITYQREPWSLYRAGCDALWREHYNELALRKDRMEMKPNEPMYEALDASGELDIIVAREAGVMVGYITSVVRPHLHYADVLCGFEDSYFLTEAARKGWAGIRLIQAWEKSMRDRGAQLIFIMTKPWLDNGPIFKRLGFDVSDHLHSKWIGA